jgi:hypothetical protein
MSYCTYNVDTKVILKGWKIRLFVKFGQFPCSWIWIQESQISVDPESETLVEIAASSYFF